MITGKSSGSGKYSFQHRSFGNQSVYVSKMPEDVLRLRVVFQRDGEVCLPTISLTNSQGQALWAALNSTAQELGWKDYDENQKRL